MATDYGVFIKSRNKWIEANFGVNAETPQEAREMAMFTLDVGPERIKVEKEKP